jgi:GntR family transcriptional regulator
MAIPLLVDKKSPIPIYYQLKEQLALLIRDGTFPIGSRLPSELDISAELGISRGTVRQAINALVSEGRLERMRGQGTFVTHPPASVLHLSELPLSFDEEMRERQVPFTRRILSHETIPAAGRLLSKLKLEQGDRVIHLESLGSVEAEPLVLAFLYLPEALCPGLLDLDLEARPLYEILEAEYGHRLARATRTIEASLADEYEAGLLQIPKGSPIHFIHSLTYLQDGRPIEYARLRYRGDRSRITLEVAR